MNIRKVGVAAVIALGVVAVGAASLPKGTDLSASAGRDWPAVAGDWGNGRYSTLKQINTGNVRQLGGAWMYKFKSETSRAAPVVVNGRMYVTAVNTIVALDAKTGETLWTQKAEVAPSNQFKGVAVGDGKVYYGTGDAHIVALDEKTGAPVWNAPVGDDLPQREGATSLTLTGQYISGAPTFVDGLVVAGMSNGDFGVRGRVVALDAKTGKQVWRFNTIAGPGEKGHDTWQQDNDVWKRAGGGAWNTPAVDRELGLLYFGVGNPVPPWGGEVRGGDNLFTDSVVALDIKTGAHRWHFQVVHHDLWEADLGTPLVFYDAVVDGKKRKALGAMRTDGYLFLLDRETGKPVHPVEERPVPQNARLKTSPTQPYPVGADQFGPDCVEKDTIPAGFKALCHFDVVDVDTPNAMYPVLTTRSAPMAYSPDTKYFYVTGSPAWQIWLKRFDDPEFFGAGISVPFVKTSGIMGAIDSRTNKLAWFKRTPYEIQNGSGFTATAGGLALHGNPDGYIQAFDDKTGDLLWQFQTGFPVNSPVSVFEIDGTQYVAATSTGAIWTFKIGGTVAPLPAPPLPRTETSFSGRLVAADAIEMSATISDAGLEKVRQAYDEYVFKPARAKVGVGAKVTWTNKGKEPHTAVAVDGSWTTGVVAPGKSATVVFAKPGSYAYHCKEHPWSYAQIVVEE